VQRSLLALLVATLAVAGARPGAQQRDVSADVDAVKAADNAVWDAVNACDVGSWNQLISDRFVLVSIGGTIYDKPKIRDDFFSNTQHPVACDTSYENHASSVRVYQDNVALVAGETALRGNGKGRQRGVSRFAYLRVFEKRDGRWQWLYGQHTTIRDHLKWPPAF
jgi:ketosteroid isomerase-like protein